MLVLSAEQVVERFEDLLLQVQSGEEVIIHDETGRIVARLAPPLRQLPRVPGLDAASVQIADDFDAPLPDDILRAFDGEAT